MDGGQYQWAVREAKGNNQTIGILGIACIPELLMGMRKCWKVWYPGDRTAAHANRCVRWFGESAPIPLIWRNWSGWLNLLLRHQICSFNLCRCENAQYAFQANTHDTCCRKNARNPIGSGYGSRSQYHQRC